VSARNRSNLSIKGECRPESEAEKCGFRNANCGMNFRLGNGTRAKPDSAQLVAPKAEAYAAARVLGRTTSLNNSGAP
jgi:hypothetical protein